MIERDIEALLRTAIEEAQAAGDLPQFDLGEIPVTRPRPEHGDYATPLALALAGEARMPPLKIAEAITEHLPAADLIGQIEVAPPGYINFTFSDPWLTQQVEKILNERTKRTLYVLADRPYGFPNLGDDKRVQVEFVSVNPNGPLTIGHGRNAAIGDTLANVLEATGYDVQREYYFNDAGLQMNLFYASVYARYMQELGFNEVELPEDGYRGTYVIDLGREIIAEEGDRFANQEEEEAIDQIGQIALQKMIDLIKEDMAYMGVRFDRWYTESSLYENGLFERALDLLRDKGFVEEKEGAIWFTSTDLGEDKDNVVVRSNGAPTYFASDIAYHYDKFFLRQFNEVIDVWGADHQGHVPRMKALMKALDLSPECLKIVVYQLVTLRRGDEIVRISTRTGDIITLREVIDEVGGDVVRFLLLQRSPNTQMDFDLELAKDTSEKNPVYYVQYAHARIASILEYAEEENVAAEGGDVALLTHEAELDLIREMLRLPEIVTTVVNDLSPHHLTHYAQELARAFHSFYKQCRVVSSDPADAELTAARLKLAEAAKLVLARTLTLIGVAAPDAM